MAQVNKIDSNFTGLAYAEEASLGVLPGSPVWNRLEPNSYNDFGGEITTKASNPITSSRQRKKGSVVDLDASGGFNHDLTFHNMLDLFQSIMFADTRRKGRSLVTAVDPDAANPDEYEVASTSGFLVGSLIKGFRFANSANNGLNLVTVVSLNASVEVANGLLVAEAVGASGAYIQVVGHQGLAGDIDVNANGDFATLTSTALNFTTLGLVVGQWIFLGGDTAATQFTNPANNGFKRVRSVTANSIVVDKSAMPMVTEANTTSTIQVFFGDVLRNESGTQIKRRSYTIERTLGAPDDALPGQMQSEFIRGAIPSEFTLNVPTADLVTVDMSFMGIDNAQRTGAQGPLQANVQVPQAAKVFNTSSDFSRIKMAIVSSTDEAPSSLFAFITEATIMVNNSLSTNKAVGTLGAFDITSGMFMVTGNVTAYFANVAAVAAVRNNADVTLDMAMVKNNQGIVFDIPLITLGDGRLNVEQDQPITLPLSMDASTGEDLGTGFDHTLAITFFSYLPTAAD